ncbi:hypothetical protein OS493_011840 [Desmophyllum pertusum]|uniref:Uncharacterized protein n=1 Tax=Desmophyllum pertusum TaxID=174260 RepID=A0A9X0CF61_9CNID|nr:hypothetical protein OS493_011840 [Desmophyllum pertusum]
MEHILNGFWTLSSSYITITLRKDDLMIQYLLPTLCKALAFLKTEGATADRVCKILESSLRSSTRVPSDLRSLWSNVSIASSTWPLSALYCYQS